MRNNILNNGYPIPNSNIPISQPIDSILYTNFIRQIKAFILGLSKSKAAWLILLALVVEFIWFSTQHIGYTSDSTTYLQVAEYLLGKRAADSFLFFRTPGYPILMILGGVPFFESFIGLLIIQALMSILIPLLIYKTLNLFIAQKRAFVGGLISILSLLPFIYSKVIMTEHAFIFFMILQLFLSSKYYKTGKPQDLYLSIFCLTMLTFIRPAANFIGLIIFSFFLIFHRKNYIPWIKALLFYLLILTAWSFWVALQVSPNLSGGLKERTSQLLFSHIYYKNTPSKNYFAKGNGPQSEKMYQTLEKFLTEFKLDACAPKYLFGPYKNDPKGLLKALFEDPNPQYSQFIFFGLNTFKNLYDPILDPDRIISKVTWETVRKKPYLLLSFISKYALGSSVSFAGQQLFFNTYVAGPYTLGINVDLIRYPFLDLNRLSKKDHPGHFRLVKLITDFLYEYPGFWEARQPSEVFGQYKGDPEKFLKESIIGRPNIHTYWFMWNAIDTMLGPNQTSNVFMKVAIERLLQVPQVGAIFIDNLASFFFGPVTNHNPGVRQVGMASILSPYWWDDVLQPSYIDELKSAYRLWDVSRVMFKVSNAWGYEWLFLKPIIIITLLMTFLGIFKSRYRALFLMFIFIILYHALVTCIFGEVMSRYIDQIMLVIIMATVMSVSATIDNFKRVEKIP